MEGNLASPERNGMDLTSTAAPLSRSQSSQTFLERLNTVWHERALQIFTFVVLAHWAEHLAQAFQIYVLKWPPPQARGVLGLWYPWLIKSEVLHYGYALVMLIGIWCCAPASWARRASGGRWRSSSS